MSDAAGLATTLGVFGGYIAGGVAGAWLTWTHAPPVGGVYWPYIRAGAAIVGGALGAQVAAVALVAILMGLLTIAAVVFR